MLKARKNQTQNCKSRLLCPRIDCFDWIARIDMQLLTSDDHWCSWILRCWRKIVLSLWTVERGASRYWPIRLFVNLAEPLASIANHGRIHFCQDRPGRGWLLLSVSLESHLSLFCKQTNIWKIHFVRIPKVTLRRWCGNIKSDRFWHSIIFSNSLSHRLSFGTTGSTIHHVICKTVAFEWFGESNGTVDGKIGALVASSPEFVVT